MHRHHGVYVEVGGQPQMAVLAFHLACTGSFGRGLLLHMLRLAGCPVSGDSPVSASFLTMGAPGLHTHTSMPGFMWVLRIQTRVFMLT